MPPSSDGYAGDTERSMDISGPPRPRDLPGNVSVYHKAADAITMVHDVGIVVPPNGKDPFILSVITTDIVDEEEAKKNMGKLASFIYGN